MTQDVEMAIQVMLPIENKGSPVLGDHNTGILVLCTILV